MSHPLSHLSDLLDSQTQQIPLDTPIDSLLTDFLSNHPITLQILQLRQFKAIFLSPLNQAYLTQIFFYLITQSSLSPNHMLKEKELESQLKITYLKVFQSIRTSRSILSHALLICNARVIYQMFRRILQGRKGKEKMEIDKIFVYQGIQRMMRVELGVEVTIMSIELMVARLFKGEKERRSLAKNRKDSEISRGEERLLPRIGGSEPKFKTRSKSINLVRNSSLKQVKNSTFYKDQPTTARSKSNHYKIKLDPVPTEFKTPLRSKKTNPHSKTQQSPSHPSQSPHPYLKLLTQPTQVLKYQKIQLYRQIAQSAYKASCQYQYQTPMQVLADNTVSKEMLHEIFKNNRRMDKAVSSRIFEKEGKVAGRAELIKTVSREIDIEPEEVKREKTKEEMFEEELMLGKYRNRSKQYKNAYKQFVG